MQYRPQRDVDVMKHEHALNDNHKFYFYPLCSKVDKSIGVFWLWLHSTMVSAWKFVLESTLEKAWKMVFVEWRNVNNINYLVSLFIFKKFDQYQTLSTGGEKIIDTFQKQSAHTLKFSHRILFLSSDED